MIAITASLFPDFNVLLYFSKLSQFIIGIEFKVINNQFPFIASSVEF
jgi:hypothetical protein